MKEQSGQSHRDRMGPLAVTGAADYAIGSNPPYTLFAASAIPRGEEALQRRLRTMLGIAGRTMRP